jgi:hypothetical protein
MPNKSLIEIFGQLDPPMLLRAGSTIRVTVTNHASFPNRIRIELHGHPIDSKKPLKLRMKCRAIVRR